MSNSISNSMSFKVHSFQDLTKQLAGFGLNPREWRLWRSPVQKPGVLHFAHRNDREFKLTAEFGRCEEIGLRVRSLRLISL